MSNFVLHGSKLPVSEKEDEDKKKVKKSMTTALTLPTQKKIKEENLPERLWAHHLILGRPVLLLPCT